MTGSALWAICSASILGLLLLLSGRDDGFVVEALRVPNGVSWHDLREVVDAETRVVRLATRPLQVRVVLVPFLKKVSGELGERF